MKRHVQTIALALLWPATLLAQSEWSWQNPLPQGYTLYDLHIFDANTVLVVGEAATAIKTMDGGASWSLQHNLGGEGITVELESVSFVDANTGFAVGPGDRIFKTTDGGATWSVQSAGVFSTLHGVDFTNPQTGWAVGDAGTILKTTDGGANWSAQTSGTTQALNAVDFFNNNAGSAVGRGGTILTTTNGGATWVPRTSGTTQVLNAVQIINTTTAVAVGNGGVILKTTDGGANFAQYKTFDFMSKRAKPTANPLAEKRVETAVEQQLIAKGYEKQTSGRPDFFVVCHANVRDKIDVDTYGYRYGRYGRRIGTYTTVREYQHGTLVVDFVDANTKELFWRGWAKGEVNDAIAKEKIDDTIAKILAKYPPQ